jgi:hypothetical protein
MLLLQVGANKPEGVRKGASSSVLGQAFDTVLQQAAAIESASNRILVSGPLGGTIASCACLQPASEGALAWPPVRSSTEKPACMCTRMHCCLHTWGPPACTSIVPRALLVYACTDINGAGGTVHAVVRARHQGTWHGLVVGAPMSKLCCWLLCCAVLCCAVGGGTSQVVVARSRPVRFSGSPRSALGS